MATEISFHGPYIKPSRFNNAFPARWINWSDSKKEERFVTNVRIVNGLDGNELSIPLPSLDDPFKTS